jgi:hypothetical protein
MAHDEQGDKHTTPYHTATHFTQYSTKLT